MTQPSDRARQAEDAAMKYWQFGHMAEQGADIPHRLIQAFATFERETFAAGVEADEIERDIRTALWNTGCWQGNRQVVTQSFIRHAMEEPCMIRALTAIRNLILAFPASEQIAENANCSDASEDRNEEPSALVTVGEPNGGDHEHGRVTGQAGTSVPAAQTAGEGLDADALVDVVARAMRNSPYYENDGSDPITLDVDCEVNFNGLARAALSAIRPTLDADRATWGGEVADWLRLRADKIPDDFIRCVSLRTAADDIRSGAYRSDERG